MSDKDKHIPPVYSTSDIEKYLNGELSAPEMHALERAALDDPFLADALDGMVIHRHLPEQPSFHKDITGLQEQLQKRVATKEKSQRRVIPLYLRYAAVVILLLGLGLTAYYTLLYRGPSQNEAFLQKRVQHSPAVSDATSAPVVASTPVTHPADTNPTRSSANTQSESEESGLVARRTDSKPSTYLRIEDQHQYKLAEKKQQDKAITVPDNEPLAYNSTPSGKAVLDTLQLHFDTIPLASSYAFTPNAGKDLDRQAFASTAPLVFSGKVTDGNNKPLPGAFLALKNNQNINAVTDKYGNFNLRLNNRMDTASVVVNYVGYEQASLLLNTDNIKGNVIHLQPQSASLNEVQIVGYGSKRKELLRKNIDATHKPLSLEAVPADGWPAYHHYLDTNKHSANLDSTLRGDETVSFIVNKKGELSSFKVEQSISPAHDSATIQMIKQGPAWKLLSGKKARARIILTY